MANRTVKDAVSIRGTNPQYLIEKIIRSRVYDSQYWKEECFALTAELLVDKAMEINYIGGVFGGNIKPTPFVCLLLKMLQIQPEKDIIVEFIKNEEFKYVRALGAFYMRLTGTSLDCYKYLEPLLNDYRKLRYKNRQGVFELMYVDVYIDQLLREERCCDIILPRIQKRHVLEANNELEPRISVLEEGLDEGESNEEEDVEDILPTYNRSTENGYQSMHSPKDKVREDKDRDKDRKRRKRSHSRERKHHHNNRIHDSKRLKLRKHHRDKDKDKEKEKEKDSRETNKYNKHSESSKEKSKEKNKQTSSKSTKDLEIQEANALRAKLGLAPLRN